MRITYTEFINNLKTAWNYKYHNTLDSVNEPYPLNELPSSIIKSLHLPINYSNQNELLYHADYLYIKKLPNYKPYQCSIYYNNPKPFVKSVYATNLKSARHLAVLEFSNYLKASNNNLYSVSKIYLSLSTGSMSIKIREI